MQSVVDKINNWIIKVPNEFSGMSELEVSQRPMPDKWSKKEILGHLCDSAINNLERFIKIQYEEQPFALTPYNQDQWVDIQDYQDISIEEIINLWCGLNKKIIKIIAKTPYEKLAYQCDIGNNQMKTLEWLIQDYLEHMEHHLKNQVFN
ncbi:DinB family protein [Peribacillus butanolivorans]|uniref:DinB family protein n=1 Tax=Peribacillus butanolivorans TaxID=421767 RepID=UPI001914845D|nr:DinB family protein [Peribacillus sp. TH16]MBK5501168.1 DinB family protein [Peribacillus sp. TH14]